VSPPDGRGRPWREAAPKSMRLGHGKGTAPAGTNDARRTGGLDGLDGSRPLCHRRDRVSEVDR
jgi:hypothetical protein